MNERAERYNYLIDPQGDSTPNKVLRLVGQGKRVLELGTAAGTMTEALVTVNHCQVTGVEIDTEMAEQARPWCEHLEILDLDQADLCQVFAGQTFDVVVAADVLEHLRDPWRCLEQTRALLAPEGYLVISVPNISHNAVIAELLCGRFPYQPKGLLDSTHLRFFTRETLEQTLLGCGYLPCIWEFNRVAEDQTEFAAAWAALAEPVRRQLQQQLHGQVYQFIVQAYPASEPGRLVQLCAELVAAQTQQQVTEQRLAEQQQQITEQEQQYVELQQRYAQAVHEREQYSESLQAQTRTVHELQQNYAQLHQAYQVLSQRLSRRIADALCRRLAKLWPYRP